MTDQITPQLRLRVFAGPNGSGKSTVIKSIRETEVNENVRLDLGVYINADDIAQNLKADKFSFQPYEVNCTLADLVNFGETSGLLSNDFYVKQFSNSIKISGYKLSLTKAESLDRVAHIIMKQSRQENIQMEIQTKYFHSSFYPRKL